VKLEIGKTTSLEVLRAVSMGVILGGPEREVLLPTRYVPAGVSPGDFIEVFLHTDSEDRPIATTEKPLAQADEFACLRVVAVNSVGAFLDWGLSKDLLLPYRSQLGPVAPGQRIVVRVLCDPISGRPVATAKTERFLETPPDDLPAGQAVQLLIYEATDLGYKAIVDGRYGGLVHREAAGGGLEIGSSLAGYVQRVRADGKVDLMLTRTGKAAIRDAREVLLEALVREGGRLALCDRSEPEEIRRTLGLSKKAFKRAVGALYRERRIRILEGGLEVVEAEGRVSDSPEHA